MDYLLEACGGLCIGVKISTLHSGMSIMARKKLKALPRCSLDFRGVLGVNLFWSFQLNLFWLEFLSSTGQLFVIPCSLELGLIEIVNVQVSTYITKRFFAQNELKRPASDQRPSGLM